MTNATNNSNTSGRHWKHAIAGGVVVGVLLVLFKGASFGSALISGAAVAVAAGIILTRVVGNRDVAEMAAEAQERDEQAVAAAMQAARAEPEEAEEPAPQPAEAAPEPAPAQISASSLVKPSTPLPGQQELAERKGTWRYEGA